MENTAVEQTKRKMTVQTAAATYVMEVRLALIVAAAKMMISLSVKMGSVSIMKMQSQTIKVIK